MTVFEYFLLGLVVCGVIVFIAKQARKSDAYSESQAQQTTKLKTLSSIDLWTLDREYGRLCLTATRPNSRYLYDVVYPALAGRLVQGDEFDQHEFRRRFSADVSKITSVLLDLRLGATATFGDYDFGNDIFPVRVTLHLEGGLSKLNLRIHSSIANKPNSDTGDDVFLFSELTLQNAEVAKNFRRTLQPSSAAQCIVRPVRATFSEYSSDSYACFLWLEVLGLRIFNGETDKYLLDGLRSDRVSA